jgi:cytidylate kinase
MSHSQVIAIDGPSGSGKSTMARLLAQKLGVLFIDTGSMYRALAYASNARGLKFEEGAILNDFLNSLKLEYGVSEDVLIKVDGEDLTLKIREHNSSKLASQISKLPSVRVFLVNFQRELAKSSVCVMEGRDIGTVVFPDSFCKLFVTASVEVRSLRRLNQLIENNEEGHTLEEVMKDVEKRDYEDINRDVAPLKPAEDSIILDTSEMSSDEVLIRLVELCKANAEKNGIPL